MKQAVRHSHVQAIECPCRDRTCQMSSVEQCVPRLILIDRLKLYIFFEIGRLHLKPPNWPCSCALSGHQDVGSILVLEPLASKNALHIRKSSTEISCYTRDAQRHGPDQESLQANGQNGQIGQTGQTGKHLQQRLCNNTVLEEPCQKSLEKSVYSMNQACHLHGSSCVQLFYLFLKPRQPNYQPLIANTFWGQRLLQGLPSCTLTCIQHALSCPNLYMYNFSAHPWVHLNQYGRQIPSFQ